MTKLRVGNLIVSNGKTGFSKIRTVEQLDGSTVDVPFFVINGAKSGPILYLGAAIHGNELTGIEIIRRIITQTDPRKLEGAIVAVPVQNPLALRSRIKFTATDYYTDMNKIFPGDPYGCLTERMAYKLASEVVHKADYIIDFHTGVRARNCFVTPSSRRESESKKLAKVFGVKFIVKGTFPILNGVPAIAVELGESERIDKEFVDLGVRGVTNVMKYLKMIEGELEGLPENYVLSDRWVQIRATGGGTHFPHVKLGDKVSKGDIVASVYNLFSFEEKEVRSSENGFVIRIMVPSIVQEGDRLAALAAI